MAGDAEQDDRKGIRSRIQFSAVFNLKGGRVGWRKEFL